MQHIWADFNRLGMLDHEEPNVIPLGPENAFNLIEHELHEGERAVFYEEDSLQAEGILKSVMVEGCRFWLAAIDMATLIHLDISISMPETIPEPSDLLP